MLDWAEMSEKRARSLDERSIGGRKFNHYV